MKSFQPKVLSLVIVILNFSSSLVVRSQHGVGIGTTDVHNSAALHIQSSDYHGLLIPRYETEEVSSIVDPANGLMVFDREKRVLAYYDGLYVNEDFTVGRWEFMRGLPVGGIIMWSGSEDDVPEGFELCDGREVNGIKTPNLVSAFIRGSTITSDDYTGALDVIPNLGAIDENLIYDLDTSPYGTNPCSAFEFIYTTSVTYPDDCTDPSIPASYTVDRLGNSCEEDFPIVISPICTPEVEYCISVAPNPNYYLLSPNDCLNEDILLYWDLAYIMRVD